MALIVALDTNVLLARCLDPAMDAKGQLADQVFHVLREAGIEPHVTQSVRREFEERLHARIGQIADAVRKLSRQQAPIPSAPGTTVLGLMEEVFSRLRAAAPDASGALQLLEARLSRAVANRTLTTDDQWHEILSMIVLETTVLMSEVQRRYDVAGIRVIPRVGRLSVEKYVGIVQGRDQEHIASIDALSETRASPVIFVTLESKLHAIRDQIAKLAPGCVVTTPTYLGEQIRRLAED